MFRWLLVAVAAPLAAQTLSGTVTNSLTHAPIPDAAVFLLSHATDESSDTISDAAGRFRFTGLPPGEYRVAVQKDGFDSPHAPLEVHFTAAADPPELNLSLTPWSTIRGRVLDADRHPVAQTTVVLYARWRDEESIELSDSEGRFVFNRVPRGEYALNAQPAPGGDSAKATQPGATWFPSATDQVDAGSIVVNSGADLSGYDIVLRPVPAVRLSGTITDERGKPAAGAMVSLRLDTAETPTAGSSDNGSFEFRNVRRGVAHLTAELHRDNTVLRSFASVLIADHDVENIPLHLHLPLVLSATVEPADPQVHGEGNATLIPVDKNGTRISTSLKPGGARFENAYPGRYRIFASGNFAGLYLDAVMLGERDIMGEEFELVEGGPPLRFLLKAGGGRVRGTVETGSGAGVLLVPPDGRPVLLPSSCCDGGGFEFASVRPGDYYAVAFHASDGPSLQDPTVYRDLIPHAVAVHVESGGVAWVELKLPPHR
jgi:hypothetical protein